MSRSILFTLCIALIVMMMMMMMCTVTAVELELESEMDADLELESSMSLPSEKVKLAYYIEAYCPRCIDVLTNSLVDGMKHFADIVELEVIPFGNGDEKNGVVTCQHGAKECHANTLQGCAQNFYPDTKVWFPFVVCMEKQADPLQAASWCAKKHHIDFQKVEACATSDIGRQILYKNARKTLDLQPPNKYVPWITVNNKPFEDPENIWAAVCSQLRSAELKNKYCQNVKRYEN